ncbi:hypothetical protein [Streptomyces sp. NPDC058268]|uniref:hypothetical protein n=1 Tax=Streptomyces sp. NPDC058268 TaxID=3346413 RepID=UPI0036EC21F9
MSHLSLPDVGVGLFVHPARQTVAGLHGDLPTRLVGAVEDSVVVFGSDGGGALFALSRTDGATVYRLPPGRVDGDLYHCAPTADDLAASPQGFLTLAASPQGFLTLAPSLQGFLTHVEAQLRPI